MFFCWLSNAMLLEKEEAFCIKSRKKGEYAPNSKGIIKYIALSSISRTNPVHSKVLMVVWLRQ